MDYRNDNNNPWKYNDSSNSPYHNQPTYSPYRKEAFSIASAICGLCCFLFWCTGILPIPLGALSILFAILAKRKGRKMHHLAITGIVLSCIGIVTAVFILATTYLLLPYMMKDETYRNQLNAVSQQLYGQSFEDLLKDTYGIDMDEYLEDTGDNENE